MRAGLTSTNPALAFVQMEQLHLKRSIHPGATPAQPVRGECLVYSVMTPVN